MQVNVYIFSTNSLQQLKKFPFRNFERDFFQFDFFLTFFSGENGLLGHALSARWTPSFVFLRQAAAFFLSFWNFSAREVRDQYFWLKPPFKEFRTRLEEQEFTGKIQGHSHYLWPLRFWFLDEFLQGTHLSVILTGTGVARWRWASKVF